MVREGIMHLKKARELFKQAKAVKTLERVRFALKSAEGAERHAENDPYRLERNGFEGIIPRTKEEYEEHIATRIPDSRPR